jgi:hypothetical protein
MDELSSSSQNPCVAEAPPKYENGDGVPAEPHKYVENELEILKDYDTVIIVDDSGSMTADNLSLWREVSDSFSPLWIGSTPEPRLLLL